MTLTARFLTHDDLESFDRFLKPHTAEAFFLRSNARRAGLHWAGNPFEGQYIGVFDGTGAYKAVIAYTWINTITAHAENAEDLAPAIPLLKSCIYERGGLIEAICAMNPAGDYITTGLALSPEASRRDDLEFFYKLHLPAQSSDRTPSIPFHVRVADASDSPTLCAWRIDFNIEALNAAPGEELIRKVHDEITTKIEQGELYVLADNARTTDIVSFLGISGSIPEHAHIGPVYTPPVHRGNGYAKILTMESIRMVNERRGNLVKTAGLFTANPSAIKVYEAVGFKQTGTFRLNLLREDFRYTPSML